MMRPLYFLGCLDANKAMHMISLIQYIFTDTVMGDKDDGSGNDTGSPEPE